MTDQPTVDLEALEALLAGASPAPWQWLDGDGEAKGDELQDGRGEMVATSFRDDLLVDVTDGRLCTAARNALPALIARLRAAEEVCEAANDYLDRDRNTNALRAALTTWEATQ